MLNVLEDVTTAQAMTTRARGKKRKAPASAKATTLEPNPVDAKYEELHATLTPLAPTDAEYKTLEKHIRETESSKVGGELCRTFD